MYFPQTTTGAVTLLGAIGGVALQAKQRGMTKMAIVTCVEVPICTPLYDQGPVGAAKFGVSLVYRTKVSLAQPDYTSVCQSMQSAGAQFMVAALDPNSFSRFARSCLSVNYHPIYGTGGPVVNDTVFQDPNLDGMLVGSAIIPGSVDSNAGVQEFHKAMQQYAPGVPQDGAAITGWVSAKLFEAAAHHLSDPPTSQDILNGLWSLQRDDLGGMTLPLTFAAGQDAPQTLCFFESYVQNRSLASPNNGQRTCS
jgi:branched-chain amino acid transport system substrate-binding protein